MIISFSSSPLWISAKEKLNPIKMMFKNPLVSIIKRTKIRSRLYQFISDESGGMKFIN
jgi:hypothetical protein